MGFLDNLKKGVDALSRNTRTKLQEGQKIATEKLKEFENYVLEKSPEIRANINKRYEEAEKFALTQIEEAKKAINTDWNQVQTDIQKRFDEVNKYAGERLDEFRKLAMERTGIAEEVVKGRIEALQKTFNETALKAIDRIEENLKKIRKNLSPPPAPPSPPPPESGPPTGI